MIYLHTIGDALIKVGDKEIRPTSPLLFAALLYLCIERGRRVPRAALQELLFPNADERSGAHSLRQLLYKLRRLGAHLTTDASNVCLGDDQVCDDNAVDLSAANGNATSMDRYARGLLPNYEPSFSERFAEWLDEWRASASAVTRRLLVSELSARRNALNWSAVERIARVLLSWDPLNEEATLALAEATALSGAKAEALSILTRYERETGREDLRISSSILRKRISESARTPRKTSMNTPFVGREDDAAAIRRQILNARTAKPSLVILSGEAGIGKSRLLEECVDAATLDGVSTHVVRCRPHYASRPLSAFIELVPSLLSSRGALGVSPKWLAPLHQLTRHDDNDDRPMDAHDGALRADVLLAAIRDLVDAVASEAPLLFAIEDVHWADADSVRLLSELVDGRTTRPVTVIFTTRVLEPIMCSVAPCDSLMVRRLKPLATPAMERLARCLLVSADYQDAEEMACWCVKTAAGNALFLRMLCAHYMETGQPFQVPPDLLSATKGRLELLSQDCRRILELCAMLGPHSTTDSLRSLAEFTPLQLVNSVQRLEDEGYLHLKDDSIRPAHDLLSDCTLGLITPVAKRVLHVSIAEWLERRYETSRDAAVLWDCAEQWLLGGEAHKAVQSLKKCASHALQMGRASYALTVLSKARDLATSSRDVKEVVSEMMVAARAAGEWAEVKKLSNEFAQLPAHDLQSSKHTLRELIAIEARWFVDLDSAAVTTQLLDCVHAANADAEHRVQAAHHLIRVAPERGDPELASVAIRAIQHLLDPRSLHLSNRVVPIAYHTAFGDQETAACLARALLRDVEDFDSVFTQFRIVSTAGNCLMLLGHFAEALAAFQSSYLKARELGLSAFERELCCYLCLTHVMQENFDAAHEYYSRLASVSMPSMGLTQTLLSAGIELAVSRCDAVAARELVRSTARGSIRHAAYFRAMEVRTEQLDERFRCTDGDLDELVQRFETTKKFLCADSLAHAICEDLRRKGRAADAVALVDEYVRSSRRERAPLPPSFAAVVTRCRLEVTTPTTAYATSN